MSGIPSKTARQAKNQQSMTHKEEKNQSIETDWEMTQIIELLNKDIKTITIIFLYSKKKGEILNMLSSDTNDNKNIELLDVKLTMSDMKNTFAWIENKRGVSEEKTGESEDIARESTQNETQRP